MKKEELKEGSYNEHKKWDLSVITLILSNLIPLIGVLFLKWGIFLILLVYWLESAVIGFYTILKIAWSKGQVHPNIPDGPVENPIEANAKSSEINLAMKIFLVPFFMIHYGGFMLGHLAFIFAISSMNKGAFPSLIEAILTVLVSTISLLVSHGISFYTHYIKEKEYERAAAPVIMMSPYGRIIVMHITILFGGFLIMATQLPIALISLFIILKVFVDIRAHRAEHKKYSSTAKLKTRI